MLLRPGSKLTRADPEPDPEAHPLLRRVRRRLKELADPDRARPMQAYMKSAMPFLGVDAPSQRTLWRELFTQAEVMSFDEWTRVILTLWRQAKYREERYAAIALADWRTYRAFRTRRAIPMLDEMIVSGAWWDFVDALATHHLADVLAAERDAGRGASMKRLLLNWARGNNLWKRRAAILCQLRFKRETDLDLLYACIEPSLLDARVPNGPPKGGPYVRNGPAKAGPHVPNGPPEGGPYVRDIRHDFFMRKAIGWALRQYARVDPAEVKRYVDANRARLSPLSVREAIKRMDGVRGSRF
jgi:3-methyladenine DNA glycosylase AlkD